MHFEVISFYFLLFSSSPGLQLPAVCPGYQVPATLQLVTQNVPNDFLTAKAYNGPVFPFALPIARAQWSVSLLCLSHSLSPPSTLPRSLVCSPHTVARSSLHAFSNFLKEFKVSNQLFDFGKQDWKSKNFNVLWFALFGKLF
ncbi:Protein CBG27456 [Caenorhabditis briggsae]|uniref:Protein CBG27456 n=1 Tax=Caenorhabditis briggsae TaxID=6238 RepID=B6IK33_CAEBR|nr:Protein CBG27456 [Caenorhabditis briggsae]CAS00263.1 Protein CBG27456 [Caenorhabditis briggsae]